MMEKKFKKIVKDMADKLMADKDARCAIFEARVAVFPDGTGTSHARIDKGAAAKPSKKYEFSPRSYKHMHELALGRVRDREWTWAKYLAWNALFLLERGKQPKADLMSEVSKMNRHEKERLVRELRDELGTKLENF